MFRESIHKQMFTGSTGSDKSHKSCASDMWGPSMNFGDSFKLDKTKEDVWGPSINFAESLKFDKKDSPDSIFGTENANQGIVQNTFELLLITS